MIISRRIAVFACLGTACCSAPRPEQTPPPPVAQPVPAPAPTSPAPPPVANWMDAPQSPGDWYYRTSTGSTAALFGSAGSEARFAITCLKGQRGVTLARAGTSPQTAPMTIRTETADRTVSATPSGGEMPSMVATLNANDPLLDAIAFSKGRFAVEVPGQSALYIPSWPEITRVIEDCR